MISFELSIHDVCSYFPADKPKDAFDGNQFILEYNPSAIMFVNVDEFFDKSKAESPKISKKGQQTLF